MQSADDPVVDVHCHVFTQQARDLIEASYSREQIVANEPYDLYAGEGTVETNREMLPRIRTKMTTPSERLADMDRMGIDVQVLSTFVSQFSYWTDAGLGQQLARVQNEWLAELVATNPQRFAAIGTVPMQDSAHAVAELDHMVNDLGFKGVQISSNVAGLDLDDPRFRPFFERAEQLGAVVVIHPNGFTEMNRFRDFFLVNVLGNPLDSTLALTRLIYAGVLEDLPELKLCVVHGGGFLPVYHARIDHGWQVRPECRKHISQPPSTYLKKVHFDTMVFSPQVLGHLIQFAGADHVMLGTDYPFDMGEDNPVGLVDSVPGLTPDDLAAVRGRNAVRLFGLDGAT
ncbi:MAG: amidohydrolase family protein [Streptomycetales bacterium]